MPARPDVCFDTTSFAMLQLGAAACFHCEGPAVRPQVLGTFGCALSWVPAPSARTDFGVIVLFSLFLVCGFGFVFVFIGLFFLQGQSASPRILHLSHWFFYSWGMAEASDEALK
mmetsp:Transcript_67055/g.165406  ORF Transcript_67055/g.165406 Transcript_67055/m.165406 type:complete len:114 (+) Transcript_67055:1853-2194(+)